MKWTFCDMAQSAAHRGFDRVTIERGNSQETYVTLRDSRGPRLETRVLAQPFDVVQREALQGLESAGLRAHILDERIDGYVCSRRDPYEHLRRPAWLDDPETVASVEACYGGKR